MVTVPKPTLRDIDSVLFDIDRVLEDQHFPPEYWAKVDELTELCNSHAGVCVTHGMHAMDCCNQATVYARPMFELLIAGNDACECPDEETLGYRPGWGDGRYCYLPNQALYDYCWACEAPAREDDPELSAIGLCRYCHEEITGVWISGVNS